jgi:hypothetical protein
MRFTSTRSPTSRVFSIDPEGMENGLTMKVVMMRTTPTAIANVTGISHHDDFLPPLMNEAFALPENG